MRQRKACTECGDTAVARGLCNKHYRQLRMQEPEYAARQLQHEARRCADPERVARRNARRRAHREEKLAGLPPRQRLGVLERARRSARKTRSHFPHEVVLFCRETQGGLCAVCFVELNHVRNSPAEEQADHCHSSRRPRGLLCRPWNLSVGQYEKFQRKAGLLIHPYEDYLISPPAYFYAVRLPTTET